MRPRRARTLSRSLLATCALMVGLLLVAPSPFLGGSHQRAAVLSSLAPTRAGSFRGGIPPRKQVNFTGNLASDFGPAYYVNTNASAWGATNNLSALYVAFDSSYLFLGLSEVITGNSLMVFAGNGANDGGIGTYNLSGLNEWGRGISFSSATTDLAAVYFGSTNGDLSGYGAFQVLTPPSDSNSTPFLRGIPSFTDFSATNDTVEIALPLSTIFPVNGAPDGNVSLSVFVVGGSGAWVGTGIPYAQAGAYNDGGSEGTFLVSQSLRIPLNGLPLSKPQPINVAIVFNDHQPLYQVAGETDYNLPWTWAHASAEYIEQPLLIHQFPSVNITYELSGSLIYQLQNISQDASYNDSFQQGAWIPFTELNTTANQSELSQLEGDWFSVPSYVYDFPEPASALYQELDSEWSSGGHLTASQYEDAKVLWFLYEISTDLVEGRLGPAGMSPGIWALHNQTSFNNEELREIIAYAHGLVGQVLPAFERDRRGNPSGSNNVELFTSPFYHPLTPLLLASSLSGPAGSIPKGSYSSDVLAQINLSRDQFNQIFGAYPHGLYASELAVSEGMVDPINVSGAQWTLTDEWTLQQSGVPAEAYGNSGWTVGSLEDLYTPYAVAGANGTSTDVFFRDAPLSNDWAFDYGNLPTNTAIADIVDYLKGVNASLPVGDHPRTLVTLALDGENWQFMSPFADDGIPFLQGLYRALAENCSSIHTITPTQFLEQAKQQGIELPQLGAIATGSWNQGSGSAAPFQSNPSLTQWSGYNTQNWMWVDLDQVRARVVAVQNAHGLAQIENLTAFQEELKASSPEGNITRAWYGIYNAEGSDWFFQMAPWTISGANTVPFNATFQGDLAYALSELNLTGQVAPPPPVRHVSVLFGTDPASCGPVAFNGTSWTSGSEGVFLPGNYTASVSSCPGYDFLGWSSSTNVTLATPNAEGTLLRLRGNATLLADFSPEVRPPPPYFEVKVVVDPGFCGPLLLNGSNQLTNSSFATLAGSLLAEALPCSGYAFSAWSLQGGLSGSSSSANLTLWVSGNGTLTATYEVASHTSPPSSSGSPPPSAAQPQPSSTLEDWEVLALVAVLAAVVVAAVVRLLPRGPARRPPIGEAPANAPTSERERSS